MRLIDADALKGRFVHGRYDDVYISEKEVQDAPTVDAVQVVRCKDCRHKCGEHDGYICCDKNRWHEPDWFCADGERKKNERRKNCNH